MIITGAPVEQLPFEEAEYWEELCTIMEWSKTHVTSIGRSAFFGCSSLTSITFGGTMAQWNAMSKGSDWNSDTGAYTITCTDGVIHK